MHPVLHQMKNIITICITVIVLALPVLAQESSSDRWEKAQEEMKAMMGSVPVMFTKLPMSVRINAWELFKSINNPNTVIPSKYGELIGLAVAAQIPCEYCVTAHTTLAKLFGATDEEIQEAVTKGAETRFFSTILNGNLTDADKESYNSDWNKIIEFMKAHNK
ncbi:carboxymuconolactone decarboxylase family protein [bacterium BMS3Abin03]|nr:carboxymuconolactone decarboxylase family protein [bacterium BMS3Abin03]MCG6960054.1 carboxymuconolactone decarboxylase family protein [bacterium BMS3Abin03]